MKWRWFRRKAKTPPTRPNGNGAAARHALAESARLIARDRQRVDSFTREIRQILGGPQ